MINLIFLIRSLEIGGKERQLVELAKGINKSRFNLTVVTFYSGGAFYEELKKEGIKVVSLEKKGRWDVIGFFYRFNRLLRHLKPHVIQSFLGGPNALVIIFKPLFSKVRMVWTLGSSNMEMIKHDFLSSVITKINCFFSRFTNCIFVNSNAGYEYAIEQGYPKRKIFIVHNGIDTEKFKPDKNSGAKVRAEWNIKNDEILIGLVGRLSPEKDHINFFKGAAQLAKEREDVRFVCVGVGPDHFSDNLKRRADDLGLSDRLIWAGERYDMPSVYNALDLATSTSISEGFPNVICEAMACCVPCVVTDVGDSSKIVGKTGQVVPIKKPEFLVQGWKDCLSKNREELRLKARSRIVENFTLEKYFQKTEELLWSRE